MLYVFAVLCFLLTSDSLMLKSFQLFRGIQPLVRNYSQSTRPLSRDFKRHGNKIQVDPNNDTFRNSRIFVSNIPERITWMDLKDHFREVYKSKVVFASISRDMTTGESKGCGLVQFEGPADADRAIEEMNGSFLAGMQIAVRKDMQERRVTSNGKKEENRRSNDSAPVKSAPVKLAPVKSTPVKNSSTAAVPPRQATPIHSNTRSNSNSNSKINSDSKINSNSNDNSSTVVRSGWIDTKYTQATEGIDIDKAPPLLPEVVETIQGLVDKREEFRACKQYAEADEMRITLRREHRVQCDDVVRKWRVLSPTKADGTLRTR
jgi:hypothetical protein